MRSAADSDGPGAAAPVELAAEQRPPLTAATVLLVEDHDAIREILAEALESSGYAVEAAADGFEALGRINSGAPAAIVLYLMLPGMNGFDVLRRIRDSSRVPVLLLTARGEDVDELVAVRQAVGLTDSVRDFLHGAEAAPVGPPGRPRRRSADDAGVRDRNDEAGDRSEDRKPEHPVDHLEANRVHARRWRRRRRRRERLGR